MSREIKDFIAVFSCIAGFAIAVMVIIAVLRPACAHDAYAWIEEGGYKDANGIGCCGPRDCQRITVLSASCGPTWCVLLVDGRGEVTVAREAFYPSEDGQSWMCRFSAPTSTATCAFIGMGM